jgi:peptidoglycan hydrolase-like amidase
MLAACLGACRAAAPVAVAPHPPAPPPSTPGVAAPTPHPVPSPPPGEGQLAAASPPIRVLLAEGATVTLPEPGRRFLCTGEEGQVVVRGPLVASARPGAPAFQVGAFQLRANAEAVATRLREAGLAAQLLPRAGGMQAVVAQGEPGERAADLAARLQQLGFEALMPAGGTGGIELVGEDGDMRCSPRFLLHPLDPRPVDTGTMEVRGDLLLLPDGNEVALVNVLPLEEYLRGVVPAEMGPRTFPALEALKAQAVAARTYAVAHLGEYGAVGWDICATTTCQVYQGVGVEHPLSDRAVAETAGLVATWGGRPIDAMYHSTCAGHTEDAAALLPERAAPYLKGVPCRGEELLELGRGGREWLGEGERLVLVAGEVARAVGAAPTAKALAQRLGRGLAGPGVGGLARAFGLAGTRELLHGSGRDAEGAVLELLQLFRLAVPPPSGKLSRQEWELAVALRLAQLAGEVEELEGRVVGEGGAVWFVVQGSDRRLPLGGQATVLERQGGWWREAALGTLSGSPAVLWCVGDACPVLEVTPLAAADARSVWNSWIRELTTAEVAAKLGVSGISNVVVASRGRSGRATQVVVATPAGEIRLPAFQFRLRLGLPDTLFSVMLVERQGQQLLRFVGRGWGHGIGLCQNGAYGLALGGANFEEILKTYYTGIAVEPWSGGRK